MKMNEQKFELEGRKRKNEQLLSEIQQLELEISNMEKENERERRKLRALETYYYGIKNSWPVAFLRQVKKLLKMIVQLVTRKKSWRQLFSSSWKKKKAQQRIKKLKYSLYELGFTKRALADLRGLLKTDNRYLRQLAAWELALWHANQYTRTDARECLTYLQQATAGKAERSFLRRAAIIEAECYKLLDEIEKGKQRIADKIKEYPHPDLYLAAANLEEHPLDRVKWINKALAHFNIAPIRLKQTGEKERTPYDSIDVAAKATNVKPNMEPKVTVIIPAYNSEDGIATSIESILQQTWTNIEILVVDDCSTDGTTALIKRYAASDDRVKYLKTEINSGAYVARNIALQQAAGEFVTINDADDWSHPAKIETQVNHLLEHPQVIANTSQQARMTEELTFFRRGKPGEYIFANMSSLMFRKNPVMENLGFWDSVRFGADGEFKRRLKKVFGEKAVVDLASGPYSFQRQTKGSLTGNHVFGFHGYFMGVRKEYFDSYSNYHRVAESLRYDFPQEPRLFAVPEPMWPQREKKTADGRRHFDVIIASEFRLLGGTNMSNVEEIKAQKQKGLRTGLMQMSRYDFQSRKEMNPHIRELLDGDLVQMVVYGEEISCDLLIIRHPPVLQEWQKYLPNVKAKRVNVIVNQPPKRDYSKKGNTLYTIPDCAKRMKEYFGTTGTWYPIGPLVREALLTHHSHELHPISLASEDWVNIIDVQEWKRASRPLRSEKIKIGRHSRDQYVKWPIDRTELFKVYPESAPFEVHVLGGAAAPMKVVGELPANWYVYEFGEMHPKEFLATLDVFVYYTHPDWIEAFGRVIFEAMAVGVPVVIPPIYEQLFGDAALYAEPDDVQETIVQLMDNPDFYESQVEKAQAYVEANFGYTKHISRIESFIFDRTNHS
ncbi:glycosyltransferase [Halalkalibacterium halodurans]|uniref:glycosyltransferase n=3 Tax=Halalkalibacterium halodurans TaxID=86665 RepID=UPI001F2B36D3|nr:glycosyltransferase [Halalkalibacterium halodurans]